MSSGEFRSRGWFPTMFRGFFRIATATNGSDSLALGSESSVESESGKEEEVEIKTLAPKSEDAPCVPLAGPTVGVSSSASVSGWLRHLRPDELRGNSKRRKSLASPPRSLRGQQPNLPCRSQQRSSRTSYPTDQQLPHDQAVRQLIRKRTFYHFIFLPLLDVELCILFSRDSCHGCVGCTAISFDNFGPTQAVLFICLYPSNIHIQDQGLSIAKDRTVLLYI